MRKALFGLAFIGGAIFAISANIEVILYYMLCGSGMRECLPYLYRITGIIILPNPYMAYMNLVAPVVVVAALTIKRNWVRYSSLIWLGMFLVSVVFSSSRGGLIGIFVWGSCLILFWLFRCGGLKGIQALNRKTMILIAVSGSAAALAVGVIGLTLFAAHPSHGSDFFGSRLYIWGHALSIWKTAPWFGVGGEYIVAFRNVVPDPTAFQEYHAHNMFLTILALRGIVGLTIFVLLLSAAWYKVMKAVSASKSVWDYAMLAGLISWQVHSLFDDFMGVWPVVAVICVFGSLIVYSRSGEK